MEEHPHPSIQEQHDPNDATDPEQERRDRLRDEIDLILHKKLEEALKVKVVKTLEVKGVVEELVKEDIKEESDFVLEQEEAQNVEIAETLGDEGVVEGSCQGKEIIKKEYNFILKQLDKAVIIEEEEAVANVGDAEPP